MKTKILILIWASLLGFIASCAKKEPKILETAEKTIVAFKAVYADAAATKTYLHDDLSVNWDASEEINLFCGSFSAKFSSTGPDESGAVEFTGSLDGLIYDEAESFIAVYPYSLENDYDGETVTVILLDEQMAVAGTFADDLFIMLAQTGDRNLAFYNLCGGVRFSVTEPDVQSVTFKGNNGEALAGMVKVSFGGDGKPVVAAVTDKKAELTLTAATGTTLDPAKWYYIVALPTELNRGYTLTLHKADGTTIIKDSDKSTVIERATWGQLENVDAPARIPDNEIWYTSLDGEIIRPRYSNESFDAKILSNVYENGKGIIKFDKAVTTIGSETFMKDSSLTSIIIPDSVTGIGSSAFWACTNLASVTFPQSLTSIGAWSFLNCSSLTSVTLPESVTSIGRQAFVACKSLEAFYGKFASEDNRCLVVDQELRFFAPSGLLSYTIPDSVTSIGYMAFSSCSDLIDIVFPESLTNIGESAFDSCQGLTSVDIPELVTNIGSSAFSWCTNLNEVYVRPAIPPVLKSGIFSNCSSLTAIYVLGESLSEYKTAEGWKSYVNLFRAMAGFGDEIGYTSSDGKIVEPYSSAAIDAKIVSNTYENGKGVIKFDGPITSLGTEAFRNRIRLTSITLPMSITDVGNRAFSECDSLEAFYGGLASEDHRYLSVNGDLKAFAPRGITSYVIPKSITSIGNDAFSACLKLTRVTLPESVKKIGQRAFSGSGLSSITIPGTVTDIEPFAFYGSYLTSATVLSPVTKIGSGMFYNCRRLESVILPETVTLIGDQSFAGCRSLKEIRFPASVTRIEDLALFECENLKTVYLYSANPPELGNSVFEENPALTAIYVPARSLNDYKSASGWKEHAALFQAIPVPAESIELDKTSIRLKQNETVWLNAAIGPEDATERTVIWTSSNASVATVDASGRVTARQEGRTTVTATVGNKSASCAVSVFYLIANGDFEEDENLTLSDRPGEREWRRIGGWDANGTRGDAADIVQYNGSGIDGSRCLAIISPSTNVDVGVSQVIRGLTPNEPYRATAQVKTQHVSDGAGAHLSLDYDWAPRSKGVTGTTGWITEVLEFEPEQDTVVLRLRLGNLYADSRGTAYFDNVTVAYNSDLYRRFSPKRYLDLAFYKNYLSVSDNVIDNWLGKLDLIYESYVELFRGKRPYNGKSIKIRSRDIDAWAYAGNPIQWNEDSISETLLQVADGDWCFGIMHELGHDFAPGNFPEYETATMAWDFNEESLANFRMYYALCHVPGANVRQGGKTYVGEEIRTYYKSEAESGYDRTIGKNKAVDMGDGLTYCMIRIVDKFGWGLWQDANDYLYTVPASSVNSSDWNMWQKFTYMMDALDRFTPAGQSVYDTFTQQELNVIETYLSTQK